MAATLTAIAAMQHSCSIAHAIAAMQHRCSIAHAIAALQQQLLQHCSIEMQHCTCYCSFAATAIAALQHRCSIAHAIAALQQQLLQRCSIDAALHMLLQHCSSSYCSVAA
jgi:hypothetical protein